SSVSLTSSTISYCNAGNGGDGGPGISGGNGGRGNAGGSGGGVALVANTSSVSLTSSTISYCNAGNGGDGGNLSESSGGDGGVGGRGGAIFTSSAGTLSVNSSTLDNCFAGNGGNGANAGTHRGGNGGSGGAIWTSGNITAVSSSFTGCFAGVNGTGNSTGIPGTGSAIFTTRGGTLRFNRVYSSKPVGSLVFALDTLDALNNWWGSNSNPSGLYNTTYNPWLVLGGTATPPVINLTGASAIRANLTCDSDATCHDPALEHVPDGVPLQFTLTSGKGTLSPSANRTVDGSAGTRFSPLAPGIATVNVTGDHQSIFVSVPVIGNATDLARMTLPDSSLYQNTDTRIPISVMHLTAGTGMSFNLTYDPTVIRINEITLNESYASASSLEVNATPGLVRLSLTCTDGITIGSAVPLFLLNTTGTGAIGSLTPLALHHAQWSEGSFVPLPFDTVDGSALVYRIRGDLNGNAVVDIGDTAKTAFMVVNRIPHLIPDADFNNNGRIDVGDASKIARYLVGKIAEL
ncbi:MAG: dockerin type I repeat-containing protein, partial [Methanoregula sp.]|nr:dockerin type I repeat-containing protein [Methanoregula sp.]